VAITKLKDKSMVSNGRNQIEKIVTSTACISHERAEALTIAAAEFALNITVSVLDPTNLIHASYYAHTLEEIEASKFVPVVFKKNNKEYKNQPRTASDIKRSDVEAAKNSRHSLIIIESNTDDLEDLWTLTDQIMVSRKTDRNNFDF
jgi:hypothetical protein